MSKSVSHAVSTREPYRSRVDTACDTDFDM